jgi:hypothetical protein
MRVLITLTPLMYREAIAFSLGQSRPHLEVSIATPEETEKEVRGFEPHLLVRNDTDVRALLIGVLGRLFLRSSSLAFIGAVPLVGRAARGGSALGPRPSSCVPVRPGEALPHGPHELVHAPVLLGSLVDGGHHVPVVLVAVAGQVGVAHRDGRLVGGALVLP